LIEKEEVRGGRIEGRRKRERREVVEQKGRRRKERDR
jgi:hypothetical protein